MTITIDANQIATIISDLVLIATFVTGHILHYKKVSAKIEQVGAVLEKDAPQIAEVVQEVSGVVNDLSK
jgi:hypothetical protein